MVMASCVAVLFGDKIRSQSKPFLYLFQLVAAKDPVHEAELANELINKDVQVKEVMEKTGISRATYFRLKRKTAINSNEG